ncbi:polymeric immunoglobulin receptor-like [Clarias magur]|nr:polymeric immunoglobulin receptor-like [Clarias magur]
MKILIIIVITLYLISDPVREGPKLMTANQGQNISLICNCPLEYMEFNKFVYKEDTDNFVKDIREIKANSWNSRFLISNKGSDADLSVNISDAPSVYENVLANVDSYENMNVMMRSNHRNSVTNQSDSMYQRLDPFTNQSDSGYASLTNITDQSHSHYQYSCCEGPKITNGQNTTFICNYQAEYERHYKYIQKIDNHSVVEVIRSTSTKSQNGRFSFSDDRRAKVLSVNISDAPSIYENDRAKSPPYENLNMEIRSNHRTPNSSTSQTNSSYQTLDPLTNQSDSGYESLTNTTIQSHSHYQCLNPATQIHLVYHTLHS